ncbi:MAG TPA: hypothetical protein VF692_09665, partial [Pyrinomonadaceae bacterium]
NRHEEKKGPSEERTISVVMDNAEIIEIITVQGFKRGYKSKSHAAKKIIELGLDAFLALPVLESRQDL